MYYVPYLHAALSAFREIFVELSARDTAFSLRNFNRVLCGNTALIMHGIDIKGKPNGIHLLIYRPTKSQFEYLHRIATAGYSKENDSDSGAYWIKRDTYDLYISTCEKDIPTDLLMLQHDSVLYRVQSVSEVFKEPGFKETTVYKLNPPTMLTADSVIISEVEAPRTLDEFDDVPATGNLLMEPVDEDPEG